MTSAKRKDEEVLLGGKEKRGSESLEDEEDTKSIDVNVLSLIQSPQNG